MLQESLLTDASCAAGFFLEWLCRCSGRFCLAYPSSAYVKIVSTPDKSDRWLTKNVRSVCCPVIFLQGEGVIPDPVRGVEDQLSGAESRMSEADMRKDTDGSQTTRHKRQEGGSPAGSAGQPHPWRGLPDREWQAKGRDDPARRVAVQGHHGRHWCFTEAHRPGNRPLPGYP